MKSLFVLCLSAICLATACHQTAARQDRFTLNGQIAGLKDSTLIYLVRDSVTDSTRVIKNNFQFRGQLHYGPESVMLRVKGLEAAAFLWLENEDMTLAANSSLDQVKVTGSKTQVEQDSLNLILKPMTRLQDSLTREMIAKRGSPDEQKNMPQVKKLEEQMNSVYRHYVVQKPNSVISMDLMQGSYTSWGRAFTQQIYDKLNAVNKQSKAGKQIAEFLRYNKKVEEGDPYADFVLNDINGKKVKLSDFAGKPILLEFWASWCGPCIRQNKELQKIYQKYNSSGLVIVAVSMDSEQAEWKKAVIGHLPWVNLGAFNGPNQAELTYGINALPTSFLIDKSGKIVKKHIGEAPLYAQIPEIL